MFGQFILLRWVQGGPKHRTQRQADAVIRFIAGLQEGRHRNTRNPEHGNTEAQEQTEAHGNTDELIQNKEKETSIVMVRTGGRIGPKCRQDKGRARYRSPGV